MQLSEKNHNQVFDHQLAVPKRCDILCGSGHVVFNHPGNMLFRSIMENKAGDYANAVTRSAKSRITRGIIIQVQSTGARVLKKHPIRPVWSAVVGEKRDKVLRDKTTHYLRAFLTARRRSVGVAQLPAPRRPVSDELLQEKQQEEDNAGLPFFLKDQSSSVPSTEEVEADQLADDPGSACCRSHFIERGRDAPATITVRTIQEMQESPLQPSPPCSLDVSLGSLFAFMLEESSIVKSTHSGESSPSVFDDPFAFSSTKVVVERTRMNLICHEKDALL